jgi:hypothetical protein
MREGKIKRNFLVQQELVSIEDVSSMHCLYSSLHTAGSLVTSMVTIDRASESGRNRIGIRRQGCAIYKKRRERTD